MKYNSKQENTRRKCSIWQKTTPAWLCFHSRVIVEHMSFPCLRLWRCMWKSIQLLDPGPKLTERHSQLARDQLQETAQDIRKRTINHTMRVCTEVSHFKEKKCNVVTMRSLDVLVTQNPWTYLTKHNKLLKCVW